MKKLINNIRTNKYKKAFWTTLLFLLIIVTPNVLSRFDMRLPIILQFILILSIVISYIIIYKNEFVNGLKEFKNHFFSKISFIIGMFVCAFLIVWALNGIISVIGNVEQVDFINMNGLYDINKIYCLFLVLVISPFVETFMVPVTSYSLFGKNDFLYYIVSGFLYGMFLVGFYIQDPKQLLFVLVYAIAGMLISYAYKRSNNIIVPLAIKYINAVMMVWAFMFLVY